MMTGAVATEAPRRLIALLWRLGDMRPFAEPDLLLNDESRSVAFPGVADYPYPRQDAKGAADDNEFAGSQRH